MNRRTDVHASDGSADFRLTQHDTDAPLLPVAQLERLQRFAPERLEWVFQQTQTEAEHRRAQARRREYLIATERIGGLVLVVSLCLCAVFVARQVAIAGHEWAAVAIGCTAPIGLFSAFFAKFKK